MNPILYAEDEDDDIFLLQRAANEARISNPVVSVADGQLAVDYLAGTEPYADRVQHPLPCLILLDLKMPGKSGFEVLKWVRTQPAFNVLPVIILSSSAQDTDIHRAYMQGANGYLVKPSSPQKMLEMVVALKDYWLLHNQASSLSETDNRPRRLS